MISGPSSHAESVSALFLNPIPSSAGTLSAMAASSAGSRETERRRHVLTVELMLYVHPLLHT